MEIDKTYLKILDILQSEGRLPFTELADRVDRAETTVRDRVFALEREGVLEGYHASVDLESIGYRARGIVRADADRGQIDRIADRLSDLPEIVAARLTTGPRPVHAEIVASDLQHLETILEEEMAWSELRKPQLDMVVRDLVPRRPRDLSRRYNGAPPRLPERSRR